jgi:hypothetical protein
MNVDKNKTIDKLQYAMEAVITKQKYLVMRLIPTSLFEMLLISSLEVHLIL